MKHQLPIYIATIAVVAAIGAPAIQAAGTQSGIVLAQATSPADPNHPGSKPGFMPSEQSAAAQPAAPAPQRKKSAASTGQQRHAAQSQQRQRHAAQSSQQQRHAAQSPQRRHPPTTTGSGSSKQ